MLLSVLSLSRGFTEPCNYSSVERSCLLCLTLMSVINMIPHLCEKGYIDLIELPSCLRIDAPCQET